MGKLAQQLSRYQDLQQQKKFHEILNISANADKKTINEVYHRAFSMLMQQMLSKNISQNTQEETQAILKIIEAAKNAMIEAKQQAEEEGVDVEIEEEKEEELATTAQKTEEKKRQEEEKPAASTENEIEIEIEEEKHVEKDKEESDEDLDGDARFDTARTIQHRPISIEPGDYCQRIGGRPVALVHVFEGKGGGESKELIKEAKAWLRTKMAASKLPEETVLKLVPSMPEEALFSPDQIRASVYFISPEEHKDLKNTLGNKPEFRIEEKNQIQKYGVIESSSNHNRQVKFKMIRSPEDIEKLKVPGNFVDELYEIAKRFEEMIDRKGRLKEFKLDFIPLPSAGELNVRQKAMLAYCINKEITVKDKHGQVIKAKDIVNEDLKKSSADFQAFYKNNLVGKNLENQIIEAAKTSLKKEKEEKPVPFSSHLGSSVVP